jgi:hypothetical protein
MPLDINQIKFFIERISEANQHTFQSVIKQLFYYLKKEASENPEYKRYEKERTQWKHMGTTGKWFLPEDINYAKSVSYCLFKAITEPRDKAPGLFQYLFYQELNGINIRSFKNEFLPYFIEAIDDIVNAEKTNEINEIGVTKKITFSSFWVKCLKIITPILSIVIPVMIISHNLFINSICSIILLIMLLLLSLNCFSSRNLSIILSGIFITLIFLSIEFYWLFQIYIQRLKYQDFYNSNIIFILIFCLTIITAIAILIKFRIFNALLLKPHKIVKKKNVGYFISIFVVIIVIFLFCLLSRLTSSQLINTFERIMNKYNKYPHY